jgi:hypothetical protein
LAGSFASTGRAKVASRPEVAVRCYEWTAGEPVVAVPSLPSIPAGKPGRSVFELSEPLLTFRLGEGE